MLPHSRQTATSRCSRRWWRTPANRVRTPERRRDVVERQDGDTTAQLLARCKQLGLIEGMLCRSRICSGRWADAACRTPSR
jgi:hypothetical protein